MRMLTVSKNEAGQRLDKLLAKYLNLAGKSFIYKMMRKKNITLNGKKCDGSEHLTDGRGDDREIFGSEDSEGSKEKARYRLRGRTYFTDQ